MTETAAALAARAIPMPAPGVIVRAMDEGTVLFDGRTETYFGLNTVGAEVWALLVPAHPTVGALCAQLQARYPAVPMEVLVTDVTALLADLVDSGLASYATAAAG